MIDRECLKFISDIRSSIGYKLHGEYLPRFNADIGLGNGCVSSYFDEINDAIIGVEPSPMTDYDWTEYDFMKCYISMLHEATHIYQRWKHTQAEVYSPMNKQLLFVYTCSHG